MKKQLHILLALCFSLYAADLYSQNLKILTWQVCGSMSLSTSGSPSYFNNTKTFTGVPLSSGDVEMYIGMVGCNPDPVNGGGIKLNGTTFIETNIPVLNCGFVIANNHYVISKDVFNQAVIDGGGTIVFSNFIRDYCVPGTGCNSVNDPCIEMTVFYNTSNLSTQDLDKSNSLVYPNPVKDVLNISYDKKINAVGLYNLTGQQVISKVINAKECKIDTSTLVPGTYLLKVDFNDEEKTVKIIKE